MLSGSTKGSVASKAFPGDAEKWAAVLCRDRDADGIFYYSVSTTGVYCRPSCPSRTARREHVAFHATPAAAERAGFRPCARCRPDRPTLEKQHAAAVVRACRLIETAQEMPTLVDLAAAAGLSRFHFHRIFKKIMGITPRTYAAAQRARRLHEMLPRSRTVTEAIFAAGFSSSGRFYESAADMLSMPAGSFRAGGKGETIRFAVGECALGSILVAATNRGICAISLGEDPNALLHELQDRFDNAELRGGDQQFERLVAQVIGFVECPARGLDVPLDIRGTVFQHRVWQALRGVSPGTTISYAELARRIGAPNAARAVARACAANALAVAIPCHRVVRTDGSLSGYRWGVARKRELLARERRPSPRGGRWPR